MVRKPSAGAGSAIGNVLWFILAGVWIAIGHVVTSFALAVTIIGIPLAWANLKLVAVTLAPLGKEIVNLHDPRATRCVTLRPFRMGTTSRSARLVGTTSRSAHSDWA